MKKNQKPLTEKVVLFFASNNQQIKTKKSNIRKSVGAPNVKQMHYKIYSKCYRENKRN